MKVHVEIYFIVYLATILSFFAVESEMREYKARQGDILLELAQNKISQLVAFENENLSTREHLEIHITPKGDFVPESFAAQLVFTPEDQGQKTLRFALERDLSQPERYRVHQPMQAFASQLGSTHRMHVEATFKPLIKKSRKEEWRKVLGSKKVADKIIALLENQEQVRVEHDLGLDFVPEAQRPKEHFVLKTLVTRQRLKKGQKWQIPVYVQGVKDNNDFDLHISSGQSLATLSQDPQKSILRGRGQKNGTLIVRGIRHSDGQTAEVRIQLALTTPRNVYDGNLKVGFLTLKTTPWAQLVVDGQVMGTTPLFEMSLPAGKRTLKLINEQSGLEVEHVIDVGMNERIKLDLDLRKAS